YDKRYDKNPPGFRLDIRNIKPASFDMNSFSARMYRANGEIVIPTAVGNSFLTPHIHNEDSISNAATTEDVLVCFPWGTNALEESWIKVSMGAEHYWLEIPYGFDRNPKDPLPPSVPEGRPKFAAAMKDLTSHDHVLHWQSVKYNLGEIQNHCGLSL